MKKPTFSKAALAVMLLLLSMSSFGQAYQNFAVRYNTTLKGDMLLIGNSNVGIHVSNPYNGNSTNNELDAAVFVDVHADTGVFNQRAHHLTRDGGDWRAWAPVAAGRNQRRRCKGAKNGRYWPLVL